LEKKTIITIGVMAVIVPLVLIWVYSIMWGNPFVDKKQETQDRILSGEFDFQLRQTCTDKLNSYGIHPTEGEINLCVDAAKAYAYQHFDK
jgi:hypothetical protein